MIGPETLLTAEVVVRPTHLVTAGVCAACGGRPARLFTGGWRCAGCTPAAAAGRPEPATVPNRPVLALVKEPANA